MAKKRALLLCLSADWLSLAFEAAVYKGEGLRQVGVACRDLPASRISQFRATEHWKNPKDLWGQQAAETSGNASLGGPLPSTGPGGGPPHAQPWECSLLRAFR